MPEVYLLSWSWSDIMSWSTLWGLLSVVVFIVGLLLTIIILVQDSKDSGLTGAFGGSGGSALMGARMQKDLAKITAALGVILAICLVSMGLITAKTTRDSIGAAGASDAPPTSEIGASTTDAGTEGANPLGTGLEITPITPPQSPGAGAAGTGAPRSGTPVDSPLNPEQETSGKLPPAEQK
jgi:protein translocase SecG subunit